MESSNNEAAYMLQSKVCCPKHPSKSIEYFCMHSECVDKLFCSACILKKQFCRHDQAQYIVDISEYLHQQKLTHNMRGLSSDSDIFDYVTHLEYHNDLYRGQVDDEYHKFTLELDKLQEEVTKIVRELKESVRGQLDEYIGSYNKIEENLIKKINQNFEGSFLSRYETFDDVFKKNDSSSVIGLKELIDQVKLKEIRKSFEALVSMHDQLPEIDYTRYEAIRSHMKVFQNKLAQAGVSIINLKNVSHEAKSDHSIPLSSIKKIAHSTTFSSNHTRTIYAMGVIDKNLFVGADDGWIRVFNIENFECLSSFQAHQAGIRALIVIKNTLITGSYDKTIKVWIFKLPWKSSKHTYSPEMTLVGHTSSVISLRAVTDTLIASGSADYSIKLWDLEKGTNTRSLSGHMNDVLCLSSTKNATTLISGSADRTIKVWNLEKKYSSACLKTLSGHTQFVWTLVILPDDATLFSGGLDKLIKMWDILTGQLIRNLPTEHTNHVTKLEVYSENILLSSSLDGTVKLWDYRNNSCVNTLPVKTPVSSVVLLDKTTIVCAGQDKMIYVWD